MSKKNRSTLKRYFSEGALPTADQFGDLIDSSLNTIDEGFDKSAENGFEISLIGEHEKLISFFSNSASKQAVWSVSYDKGQERLYFSRPGTEEEQLPVLILDPAGKVGVNNKEPHWTLDVGGVIGSVGRIGANPSGQKTVPADGQWHSITGMMSGCQALEVMAGVGNKGTGRYALMQATAMNTFNPNGFFFNFLGLKNRIRCQQAYYLSRTHKLKLRWYGKGRNYQLQIRTNCNYGAGIRIRYYITQLWFDEDMSDSWLQEGDAGKYD